MRLLRRDVGRHSGGASVLRSLRQTRGLPAAPRSLAPPSHAQPPTIRLLSLHRGANATKLPLERREVLPLEAPLVEERRAHRAAAEEAPREVGARPGGRVGVLKRDEDAHRLGGLVAGRRDLEDAHVGDGAVLGELDADLFGTELS